MGRRCDVLCQYNYEHINILNMFYCLLSQRYYNFTPRGLQESDMQLYNSGPTRYEFPV
jgi:hypothetical protein